MFFKLFSIQKIETCNINNLWNQIVRTGLNQHCDTSYLASSAEAIYKVVSPDMSCPYANSTCTPEVFSYYNFYLILILMPTKADIIIEEFELQLLVKDLNQNLFY